MPIEGEPLEGPVDLPTVLERGLSTAPDAVAVTDGVDRVTWRMLDDMSTRLAAGYLGLGLRPGNRVASLMPNRVALLVHYLACFRSGLVAVPLNYRYTPTEIDHAVRVSGAAMLVAHADRRADVAASCQIPLLRFGVVEAGGAEEVIAGAAMSFELLTSTAPRETSFGPGAPDDTAVVFFTSGSTGPAKGVTHTLSTLGWTVASVVAALDLTQDDRVLPASSMTHIAAFIWAFASLSVGAQVAIAHTFGPEAVLPLMRECRPTALAMIPAALTALVRDNDATRDDFASLRLCHAAGDKVSPQLSLEFSELTGLGIAEGYGMTEIGLTTINPPSGVIKPGSIGRPVPGITISVRDDADHEVAPGTVGHMWIRPHGGTTCYWRRPDATSAVVRTGWIDSGDLARFDDDGYLWFFGREKHIIVHDGSNISPIEVEGALAEHPAVAMAAVVGVPDVVHGENVRAYVTTKPGAPQPTDQELIDLARVRVGYQAPAEVVFLDELPLNPTGKVDRIALKRMAEGSAHPVIA